MNRLSLYTQKLKKEGKKAFIPFFTAFYPSEKIFSELLYSAQSCGADIIEIGIPFSDPIADGKFIQHSSDWVLKRGFRISQFISFMRNIRKEIKVPIVIMSYLNPIYKFGFDRFASFMEENGIDGIIFPDLPIEEIGILGSSFSSKGINVIKMISLSTSLKRIKMIAKKSNSFIYIVSVYGVTGVRDILDVRIKPAIKSIREITSKPLYAGFGISNPQQALEISSYVDGVIVGSSIIKIIMGREDSFSIKEVEKFLKEMRSAI